MHPHPHGRRRVGLAVLSLAALAAAQAAPGPHGVLTLVSGERIDGRLDAGAGGDDLRWVTPVFGTPLVFPATVLDLATFDADAATHAARGEWRVTLTDGDVVFGDLTAVDAATLTLATARHGALAIARSAVAALQRRSGGDIVYDGPSSELEWRVRTGAPAGAWRAVAGSLAAAKAGAELCRDDLLGKDCLVECTLSWTGNPSFRLVLGAGAERAADTAATVVEAWDDALVAWHERADGIDVVALPAVVREQGSATVRVRLQAGTFAFLDDTGKEVGRLPAAGGGAAVAVQQLYDGELRLDHLRVTRVYGDGETPPRALAADEVRGYDAAGRTFALAAGPLDAAAVASVRFAAAAPPAPVDAGAELLLQDGTRLTGEFAGVADGRLRVRVPWSPQPVATTTDALKALRVAGNTTPRRQEQCKLAIQADRFLGRIVGWSPDTGMLQWQPTLGNAPAALQSREALSFELAKSSAYFVAPKDYPHRILFTNRDEVACRIVSVTPETIAFVEPFHGSRREVPSAVVKAIEFDPRGVARVAEDARVAAPEKKDPAARRAAQREVRKQRDRSFVDAARRDTVLAQPRKYKGRPPTHLVLAENGDVLRGVLAGVTDEAVNFEMSLSSNASVPRASMVALVLFHEGAGEEPPAAKAGDRELELEVALDQETRVTLSVTGADAKSITGVSPFLGEITIAYEDVTTMVSGGLRGKAAGFFTPWKLAPMKEPPY